MNEWQAFTTTAASFPAWHRMHTKKKKNINSLPQLSSQSKCIANDWMANENRAIMKTLMRIRKCLRKRSHSKLKNHIHTIWALSERNRHYSDEREIGNRKTYRTLVRVGNRLPLHHFVRFFFFSVFYSVRCPKCASIKRSTTNKCIE